MAAQTAPQMSFMPISEISSYCPKWTICGRVTNKGPMRTFAKKGGGGGDGKVFHVELLDANGGEIRASFFNEAVDKFHDLLQVGKCYTLSKGNVKVANKQYNNTNHRYEIIFDKIAEVAEVKDDTSIAAVNFNFTDLRTLQNKTLPATIDLCGIISGFQPYVSFTSKEGRELVKREITVADDTGNSIVVAIWGDRAKQEDAKFSEHPVVALKSVLVKEFQKSRNGSLMAQGGIHFKPTAPEAEKVQRWWTEGGKSQSITSLSQAGDGSGMISSRMQNGRSCSFAEMKLAADQVGQAPEMYTVVCRLALVQTQKQGEPQPLHYTACAEPKEGNRLPCNRRLDEGGFCASCNRAGKAVERFNTRCKFADYGDSGWITTFHEGSAAVLGMKADDAKAMEQGAGGREALESAIRQRYFTQPMQVLMRGKQDFYNGEPRANVTCVDARPVPRAEHGRTLLKEIREMLATMPMAAAGA
jgi:replication factor A1